LIVSAGQDTIIEVREPESKKADADYLLLGHTHNVCTLDAIGNTIVSGSWDGYVSNVSGVAAKLLTSQELLEYGKTGRQNTFLKDMRVQFGQYLLFRRQRLLQAVQTKRLDYGGTENK
jgi:hypothetical protein